MFRLGFLVEYSICIFYICSQYTLQKFLILQKFTYFAQLQNLLVGFRNFR